MDDIQRMAEELYTRMVYEQTWHLIRLRMRAYKTGDKTMAQASIHMLSKWVSGSRTSWAAENAFRSYQMRSGVQQCAI